MFDKFLMGALWAKSLDVEAESYAQEEGARDVKPRHRIRSGLNFLNSALLYLLLFFSFGHILDYFSIRIVGTYKCLGFAMLIAVLVFVISLIIAKKIKLVWLIICTVLLVTIFCIAEYYSLTHTDLFDIKCFDFR